MKGRTQSDATVRVLLAEATQLKEQAKTLLDRAAVLERAAAALGTGAKRRHQEPERPITRNRDRREETVAWLAQRTRAFKTVTAAAGCDATPGAMAKRLDILAKEGLVLKGDKRGWWVVPTTKKEEK